MPQPTFPNTLVKSVTFSNYSGTINGRPVALHCTPEAGAPATMLRTHAAAMSAILAHCFAQSPPATLRAIGSTWSFSSILEPGDVILDTANCTFAERVPAEFFTQGYQARSAQGMVPVFVEGGAQIARLNRRLALDLGLALQTSGAGDGHRIAGCIATGTHGSAFRLGAVHDTVLGLYLMVAPNQALFVQSSEAQFASSEIAAWLAEQTGIPTRHAADDELFQAALVALGSLGIVLGVVLEATPLYRLKYKSIPRPHDDPDVWQAIRTLDTSALHPETVLHPFHFSLVLHPYPPASAAPGLVATLMWKAPAANVPFDSPLPGIPRASSDLMGLIGSLSNALAGRLTAPFALPFLRDLISEQVGLHDSTGEAFPGQMFGPTSLPPGAGASTEIVVAHEHAEVALRIVFEVLEKRRVHGEFLLGALGVRFVPQTRALLGMNANPMNCYIELPSIRSEAVLGIYRGVWDTLEERGVPFTCHWGQLHGMTPARLRRYFGDRVERWKQARERLLDPVARRVFAAPILREVGLDS